LASTPVPAAHPAPGHLASGLHLAAGTANTILNVSGIEHLLSGLFICVIALVGIRATLHAFRSGWAAALTAGLIVVIGAGIYGLATTGQFAQLGIDAAHLVLNLN
jgi:NADPH-dependent 2,4-dienoyl-CoA reductase/sulfur reductase-like enzyme